MECFSFVWDVILGPWTSPRKRVWTEEGLDALLQRARTAWEQADVATYSQVRDRLAAHGWFVDVVRQRDGSFSTVCIPLPI